MVSTPIVSAKSQKTPFTSLRERSSAKKIPISATASSSGSRIETHPRVLNNSYSPSANPTPISPTKKIKLSHSPNNFDPTTETMAGGSDNNSNSAGSKKKPKPKKRTAGKDNISSSKPHRRSLLCHSLSFVIQVTICYLLLAYFYFCPKDPSQNPFVCRNLAELHWTLEPHLRPYIAQFDHHVRDPLQRKFDKKLRPTYEDYLKPTWSYVSPQLTKASTSLKLAVRKSGAVEHVTGIYKLHVGPIVTQVIQRYDKGLRPHIVTGTQHFRHGYEVVRKSRFLKVTKTFVGHSIRLTTDHVLRPIQQKLLPSIASFYTHQVQPYILNLFSKIYQYITHDDHSIQRGFWNVKRRYRTRVLKSLQGLNEVYVSPQINKIVKKLNEYQKKGNSSDPVGEPQMRSSSFEDDHGPTHVHSARDASEDYENVSATRRSAEAQRREPLIQTADSEPETQKQATDTASGNPIASSDSKPSASHRLPPPPAKATQAEPLEPVIEELPVNARETPSRKGDIEDPDFITAEQLVMGSTAESVGDVPIEDGNEAEDEIETRAEFEGELPIEDEQGGDEDDLPEDGGLESEAELADETLTVDVDDFMDEIKTEIAYEADKPEEDKPTGRRTAEETAEERKRLEKIRDEGLVRMAELQREQLELFITNLNAKRNQANLLKHQEFVGKDRLSKIRTESNKLIDKLTKWFQKNDLVESKTASEKMTELELVVRKSKEKFRMKLIEPHMAEVDGYGKDEYAIEDRIMKQSWSVVDHYSAEVQTLLGPGLTWLADVTHHDWTSYHRFRKQSLELKTKMEGIINGVDSRFNKLVNKPEFFQEVEGVRKAIESVYTDFERSLDSLHQKHVQILIDQQKAAELEAEKDLQRKLAKGEDTRGPEALENMTPEEVRAVAADAIASLMANKAAQTPGSKARPKENSEELAELARSIMEKAHEHSQGKKTTKSQLGGKREEL